MNGVYDLMWRNDDVNYVSTENYPHLITTKADGIHRDQNILREFNKLFTFYKCYRFDDFDVLELLSELGETVYTGDFSNKIIIAAKNTVEVVKTKLGLDNLRNVLFVLNKASLNQIRNGKYHLDDLQYDIAKAIGIQPENLKLLYLSKEQRTNLKNDYTNVKITEMWETKSPSSVSKTKKYTAVVLEAELTGCKDIVLIVSVENLTHGSQWLGGYVNTRTNVYYHNAITQTEPRKRKRTLACIRFPLLNSRDTQTCAPSRDAGINLPVDHSTQMWRFDYYIPADTDQIVSPTQYRPFDVHDDDARERAAITIQKHWKKHKLRERHCVIADFSKQQADFVIQNYWRYYRPPSGYFRDEKGPLLGQVKEILKLPNPLIDDNRELFNQRILSIMFPCGRKDFLRLHHFINKYKDDRLQEMKLIENSNCRKSELYYLFERTRELLQTIEKQSSMVKKDALLKAGKKLLENLSAPIFKPDFNEDFFYVIEKEDTAVSRQFKELYVLFLKKDLSIEQRIEVLMLFMKLVDNLKNFEMKGDLLELMGRECLLLANGIPSKYMDSLRKRMHEIIHHLIQTLDSALNKVPYYDQEIYKCKSCNKLKNAENFQVYNRHKRIIKCKKCIHIFHTGRTAENIPDYQDILRHIQINEYRKGCPNPYVSLIQPEEIQYIVKKIWGGKSILSNISHLANLRLPRWDNRKPWAPWNCILLSTEEAKAHERVDNIYEFYGDHFCKIIQFKNLKAILRFRKIAGIERANRKIWHCLPRNAYHLGQESLLNAFILSGNSFFYASKRK